MAGRQQAKTFVSRMAEHVMNGLSFDEAAAQVLENDKYVRRTVMAEGEDAQRMRSALSADIYFNIRKRDAIDRALAPEDTSAVIRKLAGFSA